MYLIHTQLLPLADAVLPANAAELIALGATSSEGLEHIVIHADAEPGPIVGLFLLAASRRRAEGTALSLCLRALRQHPELRNFQIVSSNAVQPRALSGPEAGGTG